LNVKGAAQIAASIHNLAAAGASIEAATIRLALQGSGALEVQLQDASFAPPEFKSHVDAVVASLPDSTKRVTAGTETAINKIRMATTTSSSTKLNASLSAVGLDGGRPWTMLSRSAIYRRLAMRIVSFSMQ
jgi:hypothetical protein